MLRPVLSAALVTGLLSGSDVPADRWEADMRRFEAQVAEVPVDSIVFYGSSTFRLWTTLAEDLSGLPVVNRGFGGSGTSDAVRYATRVVTPLSPAWVVLYCGGNDIGAKDPAMVAAATGALIATIRTASPRTRVVLMSLKPTMKRRAQAAAVQEVNHHYRELAAREAQVIYLDLWTPFLTADGEPDLRWLAADQHHPSLAGYRRMAELLRPLITGE